MTFDEEVEFRQRCAQIIETYRAFVGVLGITPQVMRDELDAAREEYWALCEATAAPESPAHT